MVEVSEDGFELLFPKWKEKTRTMPQVLTYIPAVVAVHAYVSSVTVYHHPSQSDATKLTKTQSNTTQHNAMSAIQHKTM